MPTLFNHTLHLTAGQFAEHNDPKYQETLEFGGLNSARALAIAGSDDVLQLDPRLKHETYPFLLDHLGEIGLASEAEIVWSVEPEVAHEYPEHELSVYSFVDAFHEVRPDTQRRQATRMANNKNTFMAYCAERGYPVPKTLAFDEQRAQVDTETIRLPAYIKAARSAAGVSIFRCVTRDELKYRAGKVGKEYQIQEEVQGAFLNVQYETSEDEVKHLATTEQLLNKYKHIGNRFPSSHNSRAVTDPLAADMARLGLRDVFAFDVAMTEEGPQIIECNARWNGSTAPTKAVANLGLAAWTACNLDTSLEGPRDIKLGDDIAYSRERGYGAIILNTAFMRSEGKVTVVLAGTAEAQAETYARLREAFKIPKESDAHTIAISGRDVVVEGSTPYDSILAKED